MSQEIIFTPDENNDEILHINYVEVIENQLILITTLCETSEDIYDQFGEERIKCVSQAMKIIYKSQKAILTLI